MLGFNKYVIPFQPGDEPIPFNVSGLDTIKYSPDQFSDLARNEISKAIERTTPSDDSAPSAKLEFEQFLAQHNAVISTGFDDGERLLQDRAQPFRAILANSFSGLQYMYVLFTEEMGSESTLWRVKRLRSVLDSLPENARTRAALGLARPDSVQLVSELLRSFEIWIICRDSDEARDLRSLLNGRHVDRVKLFLLEDVAKCSRAGLRGEELTADLY